VASSQKHTHIKARVQKPYSVYDKKQLEKTIPFGTAQISENPPPPLVLLYGVRLITGYPCSTFSRFK